MTSPLTWLADHKVNHAPNAEIDSAFDRMARDWMFKAELPAGWAGEIARDYQRRAANGALQALTI